MVYSPRNTQIEPDEVEVFHCYSQCVRQAFLLGDESEGGSEKGKRRDWVKRFEQMLAGLFAVEVGFRGEMSNHIHAILRTRPDVAARWTDRDVVERWLMICKLVKATGGDYSYKEPTDRQIDAELAKEGRVDTIRGRLSSISSFMGALCEHIARRCNREDGTTGHFWADRFKSRKLEDEAALIVCGAYVDLNQVRAGEVAVPEDSTHTSVFDRIQSFLGGDQTPRPDDWMAALTAPAAANSEEERRLADELRNASATGLRVSDLGLITLNLEQYLELVDWTGRQLAAGKRGKIPTNLGPILDRLRIRQESWLDAIDQFDSLFGQFVGQAETLTRRAATLGRKFLRGQRACEAVFGTAS